MCHSCMVAKVAVTYIGTVEGSVPKKGTHRENRNTVGPVTLSGDAWSTVSPSPLSQSTMMLEPFTVAIARIHTHGSINIQYRKNPPLCP